MSNGYEEFLSGLVRLRRRGMRPGLAPTRKALAALGDPHDGLRIVHIAGTNGKGSTAAFIDAGARKAGLRTGLFTSPHLSRFTERIRVDGQEISRDDVVRLGMHLQRVAPDLTFFESTTCIGLSHFAQRSVDLAVIETGLGGRLDSTNVVTPELCVITSIARDHEQVLGEGLEKIALEKAGILKKGALWLSAPQADLVRATLPALEYVAEPWGEALTLRGEHQRINAGLAAVALRRLGVAGDAIRAAFADVFWPGRLEQIGSILLDCAHNVAAARALAAAISQSATIVFGCLRGKDARGMLEVLDGRAHRWILTRPRSDRAVPPAELRSLWGGGEVAENIEAALSRVSGPCVVTGSAYLVGEARRHLLGEESDPVPVGDP